MSKLKRFIWTLLTAAASASFAFQDDEDFSDHRFRRESSGDYDSSGDGPEVRIPVIPLDLWSFTVTIPSNHMVEPKLVLFRLAI